MLLLNRISAAAIKKRTKS